MKQIILLLFLVLFSSEIFAQQESPSGSFIHLSQVQKAPYSSDCNVQSPFCTAEILKNFIVNNINLAGSVTSGKSGQTDVMAKVIIDTLGQVSWASVKGLPAETGATLADRLKQMPVFIPGEHEGQKANVIVDLKVPLYVWEADNFSSKVYTSEELDTEAVWSRCRNAEDKMDCTSESLNHWIIRNVDTRKFKESGFHSLIAHFVVGPDGEVSRIVVQSDSEIFATEVIKTLKKMPQFEPAKSEEEPVAVNFITPVTARVQF